jgi:predicted RNase H-like nuclease (RuvC/YqgF family)
MDAGTLIALIVGVIGIAITVVIWIASTRAVNTQKAQEAPGYFRTVDEAAIERASRVYERTIDELEEEIQTRRGHEREQNEEIMRLNRELSRANRKLQALQEDTGPQPIVE